MILLKNIIFLASLAICFQGCLAQQSCVNLWDADASDQTIQICPVRTDTGENCQFPFTYNGNDYRTCIVTTDANNLPKCKTPSNVLANCMVPTDAVVTQVTTRKNGGPSTNGASLNGGTLVWISGKRFALNLFSFDPTTATSNEVFLTNGFLSYSCQIHTDKVTSTQITCYTPELPAGNYLVRVKVNGNLIPLYQYTAIQNAYVVASDNNTPKITNISPINGLPGSFLTVTGDFKTECYTRDVDGCADDSGARITRLYFGGQICTLIDPNTNNLYQTITTTSLTCKLQTTEINVYNVSMLVSEEFGRSATDRDSYLVSPNERLYNFQTYPVIQNITPSTGSVLGETYLTLTGAYFYSDNNLPAIIEVGGTPCKVVSYQKNDDLNSKLVCKTSPKPQTIPSDNYGGRGLTLIVDRVLTSFNNLGTATPSVNSVKSILDRASFKDTVKTDITAWLKGYFAPQKTSNYEFNIITNGPTVFYLSQDSSSSSKSVLISVSTTSTGSKAVAFLNAGTNYYIEAVSSRALGELNIVINAKMLDTILTDQVSSNVDNEIQEVEISSVIIPEEFNVTFDNLAVTSGVGEVQQINLNSTSRAPYMLRFDGVNTILLDFQSTRADLQTALSDLPTLGPNMVTVAQISTLDDSLKSFTLTFSELLGDVPKIEIKGNVGSEVIEVTKGSPSGSKIQLMIQNKPTPLFNLQDTVANIKNSIDETFGIRCPISIQKPLPTEAYVYDYETECQWSSNPYNETAFCGKCSRKNSNIFATNVNTSLSFRFLCFAYKLSKPISSINIQVYYLKTLISASIDVQTIPDLQWHYKCVDLYTPDSVKQYSISSLILYQASFTAALGEWYIDTVSLRKTLPFYHEDPNLVTDRRLYPNFQISQNTLSVTKPTSTVLKVSYRPNNCSYDLLPVTVRQQFQNAANNLAVNRMRLASPPVTGNYDLLWNNQTLTQLRPDLPESAYKNLLESLRDFGQASVVRSKDCSGYKYQVKWSNGGDKKQFEISNINLNGSNVSITSRTIRNGGAYFYPLLDDILRTYNSKPQVTLKINNIPAKCNASCDFEWLDSATPVVDTIDVSTRTAVRITGSGFDLTSSNNLVYIGSTLCSITSATQTELVCAPGQGPIGVYNFTVNILGKGLARMNSNTQFEYQLTGSSISPSSCGTGGGCVVNITGSGFTNNTQVTIDGSTCNILSNSYTLIICSVPSNPTNSNKTVNVIVTDGSSSATLSQQFFYDRDNTPVVSSVTPNNLSVLGKENVRIAGTNLPAPVLSVSIGGKQLKVISSTSTQIVVESLSMNPGVYDLVIPVGSLGNAYVNTKIEYKLYISSFSPRIGSKRGGTLLTIYGEGFSTNCSLNKVLFNTQECDIKTCAVDSIVCRTRHAYKVYEVSNDAVSNKFGNRYAWDRPYVTINVGDIVQWTWLQPIAVSGINFRVEQVDSPDSSVRSPGGFTSGEPTPTGTYSHQFNAPGTYYYWSGYVDPTNRISFRGVVVVRDESDNEAEINVVLNGIKAQKCSFPFQHNSTSYSACTNAGKSFNWCSPFPVSNGQFLKCDPINVVSAPSCSSKSIDGNACNQTSNQYSMKFTTCQVPRISDVSPLTISYNTEISISGSGFSSTSCENEVYINGKTCTVKSSSSSLIICELGSNSGLETNKQYEVEVLIKNIGYAIHENFFPLNFQPVITSISPSHGSPTGGTKVTILGDGFTRNTFIQLGQSSYDRRNAVINYNSIELVTNIDQGTYNVSVLVNKLDVTCESSCTFEFSSGYTPQIDSISPPTVNDSCSLVLTGSNFGTNSSYVSIKIGTENCQVTSLTDTQITCSLNGLNLGKQELKLNVQNLGNANVNNGSITGLASIKSVTPSSGSIYGGTRVRILGNGFASTGTSVKLGNSVCQIESVSINEIICLSSANAAGSVLVQINVNNQQYANNNFYFNYDSSLSPVISSVSPTSESSTNSLLTISGTGFSTDQSEVSVTIGGSRCTVQSASLTQITCILGINSAGTYSINLRISSKGNANNNTQFTYNINIASLSNTESGVAGGLTLNITGTGFSRNSRVFICNNLCKIQSSTNTELICIVPQSSDLSADSTCSLVVNENNINATSTFRYIKAITPQLSSVTPLRGGTGGGTILTITGSNLPTNQASVKVLVGGSQCDILSLSSTQIRCATGSYPNSSIKTLIQVYKEGVGLALNDNVYFEYIDLWSSRFTWGGSPPPGEGELVVIGKSQTIYFDAKTPVLKGVLIIGGNLIFDDQQDVHLQAEYIIITDGGKLQIGTEDKPFLNNAKITMYGSVRSVELPIFGSKVIALRNGTIDMHGRPVGVTWTHLSQTASAGASQITLKEPVVWPIGGSIVIATTSDNFGQGQTEVKQIIAKSSDNRTLTLDTPLGFEHLSISRTVGSGSNTYQIDIRAEVGLLSRNVLYQGHNDDSWNSLKTAQACPDGFNPGEFAVQTCFLGRYGPEVGTDEFGATIMIHGDMSRPKSDESVYVRISNVELFHVGQAFRLGRYPIHFHLNGDLPSSYVRECAIHESFNRAVNLHGTNYVTVERNVIYNIMGGAYFLEDGIEVGNTFQYNLAVFVKTSSSLLNEDSTPAAFWVTNPNNTYLHNSVAGGTHFGFWYRILDTPDGPSANPNYCPKKIPMGRFYNNTVHSVGRFGLWIFPGYTPTVSGRCSDQNPSAARFEKLYTYRNDKGAEWVMSNPLQFRNFISFEHASVGIETKTIVNNQNYNTPLSSIFYSDQSGPLIADSVIIGNTDSSASTSFTSSGLVVAWDRGMLVRNVTFINFPDSSSHGIRATEIAGRCTDSCGGWTTKFSDLKFSNVLYKTVHRWDWDLIYQDLDGSLTGRLNSVVVFNDNFTKANPNCDQTSIRNYINGVTCTNTKDWIRFAYNNLKPDYAVITNSTNFNNKKVAIPKKKKRLTHPNGFMIALEANQEYLFEFDQALYPTNVSYNAAFYSLMPGQYLIVKHQLLRKPDRVEFSGLTSTQTFAPLTSVNNKGDWYWDNDTSALSYMITNKENRQPFLDFSISFSAYKCRYDGCEPPTAPSLKLPVTARPPDALNWSSIATWTFAEPGWGGYVSKGVFELPRDGQSVKIPDGKYVVVDCPLPKIKYLYVEGILELDNGINHKLEADIIFINGGQLIIGWEKNPILTNVQIILNGVKDSLNFRLPDGLNTIGGKGIGVYGGLDIHGRPRYPAWTRLKSTVKIGTNTLTLQEPVDWEVGEKIVITTTTYKINQSEVLTITQKSGDNRTLTLNQPFQYEHLAYEKNLSASQSYKVAAGVGLLSRNVKIIGAEYAQQYSDLYGFRIIVSDYSLLNNEGIPVLYKGYARLSDVELDHPGQYSRNSDDDSKYGILFSNLGEYNYSRPSYVRSCAFHHGFSVAVGIFSSASIPIENNVVYHTLDFSLFIQGHSNIIRNNLVISNFWSPSYNTWEADFDNTFWGAIDIHSAESAIVENNFIAGAERIGFHYKGDLCPGQSLENPKYNHSIKGNTIYSSFAGVAMFPDYYLPGVDCIRIHSFTVFKSTNFGIYYQQTSNLIVDSNTLIDNQVGVLGYVIGPSILEHQKSNKFYRITNTLIVGQSYGFNCDLDKRPDSSNLNFRSSQVMKAIFSGANETGKIGIAWGQFMSGKNGAPKKPWAGIMTYNALDGLTVVENVTFTEFNLNCNNNNRDYMIASNKGNDDGQHPMLLRNIKLVNIDVSSKVWIHRPNIEKINPSDCVDMDCDGLKKNLLTDEDGSFLGRPGAVISQSEFEWGSQQRGLGDFRIPKEALAAPNGTMLPISSVYSNLGIVREENACTYEPDWQAYKCFGLNYKMLIIESMDKDTEHRRLSPVAILSDNKYLDLINGPQDHGWCFGYTCQTRVSTFMAIVAANRHYDIFLSSTPPNQLRFRILNADSNFKIRLSMYYFTSNRIDVYRNDTFIDPTNAEYKDGKLTLKDLASNPQAYMPLLSNSSGTNVLNRNDRKVYFMIGGGDYIDLKIAPVVVVKFGLPAITPEEFFNPANLVTNFANLLGVDPSKIREVKIIRESKRKRSTGLIQVSLVIYENPSQNLTSSNKTDLVESSLKQLAANISNQFTTGQLQQLAKSLFNISLETMIVARPLSNTSESEIKKVNRIMVERDASLCRERSPCAVQPILRVVDQNNNTVTGISNADYPWVVVARLASSSNPLAQLILQTEANLGSDGYVRFEKLGISEVTSSFNIQYEFKVPSGVKESSFNPMSLQQRPAESTRAVLSCVSLDSNLLYDVDQTFNLSIPIVDELTKTQITDIGWKNHTWIASVLMYQLARCQSSGNLRSLANVVTINATTGVITFNDLYVDQPGMYLLLINIRTSNNDYNFNCISNSIIIKKPTATVSFGSENVPSLVLKFNANFSLFKNNTEFFKSIFYNCIIKKYDLSLTRAIAIYEGSIVVDAGVSGNSSSLAALRTDLNSTGFNLTDGIGLSQATLFNEVIASFKELTVEIPISQIWNQVQQQQQQINEQAAKQNSVNVGLAVGLSVGLFSLLVIILIIVIVVLLYKKKNTKQRMIHPNANKNVSTYGLEKENSDDKLIFKD